MDSNFSTDFTEQCLSAPESARNTVLSAVTQDTDTSTLHATAAPLLREWAKAILAHDSWKDALRSTVNVSRLLISILVSRAGPDTLVFKFIVSRFMIYLAICERLETIDRTTEASEYFRQMVDELVDRENAPPEQAEWVTGVWSRTTYGCR